MLAGGERDMKSPPEIYDDILRLIVDFSINEPDNVLDPWLPDEYVDYHEVQARRQSGIRYCSSSHKYNMRYAFADAFMKNVYPHFVTSSTLTIAEFRNLTEIAIGKTLFFAYTFHFTTTEKCLSRGWHEVGLVIIHTLTNFVERGQDAELRELRNRYIPRWQHAKTQAQSVGGGSGRRLRRALNSISRTYLHGMRCISDDFRKSRPPRTINNFVGFILLSWTVDSKGRFGIHELGTSDGFYVDLHHWIDGLSKQADADAARAFVNILWPEWRYRSAPLALDVTEATTRALGWMDRLFSTASEEEIEELPISRFLVDRILLEQNPCSGGLGDHTLAHGLVAMNLNNPLHQPQIGVYPDDDPQFDRGDYVHIYDPDPPDIYGNPGKGNWVDIDTVMVLFATFIFAVVLAFFESIYLSSL